MQCKAQEEKKAKKQTAVMDIAEFENEMAMEDIEQKAKFP